jgi:hypothetical protein
MLIFKSFDAVRYVLLTRLLINSDKRSWQSCVAIVCYLLISIGIIWRIQYISEFNPIHEIWSDPQRHFEQGKDTLRDDPMSLADPILYQLYIGVLLKLSLTLPILVAFYTSLLSIITPWIWYRFFCELQPTNKLYPLMGWAALSVTPGWIGIYGYFMQETLLLPMLGLALYATWRCRRKRSLNSFLLMIFLWVLAGLTRGICIPMAAIACTWVWIEQSQKLAKAACSLIILALVLVPLTYRGHQKVQIFAPHGIGHLNMLYALSGKRDLDIQFLRYDGHWRYIYTSPALLLKPFEPLSEWATARTGKADLSIDISKGGHDWDSAYARYPLSVTKLLWIVKENLAYLFFAPSWPDSNRLRAVGELNYWLRWIWAPLTVLAMAWSIQRILTVRVQPLDNTQCNMQSQRLLLLIFLTWFFVQGVVPICINEGRYRKPLPGLLIAQLVLLAGSRQKVLLKKL